MRPRHAYLHSRSRRLLVPLTVGAVLALTSAAVGWRSGPSVPPTPAPAVRSALTPLPDRAREARALRVLAAWDGARADAYATGSVAALRGLYVGTAGVADVRVLRSYLRRGLQVDGMQMQVMGLKVVSHQPGRWRLRVTDRLHGAVAVGQGERISLPSDQPSTRIVVLVRGAGQTWRVAAIRG